MGLFDSLDAMTNEVDQLEQRIVRAPFSYIGSKMKSVRKILPNLPYRKSYIEVFGGSGVLLLNRSKTQLDVYNDRFGGIVCFYRCLRDKEMMEQLIEWLNNCIMSKEEYYWCKETWQDCTDEIERAARWYYSMVYSFGSKGQQWGRKTTSKTSAGCIVNKIVGFKEVHDRLQNVQIENASWPKILQDYDCPEAVFYLDPPYVGTCNEGYHFDMSHDEHRNMLEMIQDMEGFVALSGFSNSLYDSYDWDDRITWEVTCTFAGNSNTAGNKKEHLKGLEQYGQSEEVLWIKEAR